LFMLTNGEQLCVCLSVSESMVGCVRLCVCVCVCDSPHLYTHIPYTIHAYTDSVCMCVCVSVYLCVCLYVCMCVCLCVSVDGRDWHVVASVCGWQGLACCGFCVSLATLPVCGHFFPSFCTILPSGGGGYSLSRSLSFFLSVCLSD